jgi:4-amino-4-deoxy-L-arabinose transferase-like glycosyltransferase
MSSVRWALIAFVVTLFVHALHIPSQGLTDDDDFYAPAGIRYADWLGDVVTEPTKAMERKSIDKAFELNHEHPPLAKFVFGVSHALFHKATGLMRELDAARMGTALFAALLSAAMVLVLRRTLGTIAAIGAPLLLLSLPRFFFHSEVATLDVPVACAVFVVTALFFASERAGARAHDGESLARARRLEILCGLAFGVGLLVKLNAPFALIPCVLWALSSRWRGFSVDRARVALRLPSVPPALAWMIILGPIVFVALWPWLWHDTAQRLGAYFAFHLSHYPILHFFDGEIYEKPFAPWTTVPTFAWGVMPLPVVLLGAFGAVRALRAIAKMVRHADADGGAHDVDDADRLRALVLLQAGFALAITMSPSVPRYGGEKLFMPFFPLWCVLAADGLAMVIASARVLIPRAHAHVVAACCIALACAPGVAGSIKHHGGYALSYFGETVGGLRGAVARGYERTYYDVADKSLAKLLDGQAQSRAVRVAFVPNHKEYARTYRWLKRDAYVSKSLTLEADWKKAPFVVLTHERRWSTYPSLLAQLEDASRYELVSEKRIDDVPLWSLYRRR